MSEHAIFLPMLVNLLLVLVLYGMLTLRKKRAGAGQAVDESRRALHADAWPEDVQQVNNCIRNQFESPVVFYVLCLILSANQAVDLWALVAAWVFVALRYWHAYVHTGSNFVPLRRRIFTFSTVVLVGMWGLTLARLL